MKIQVTHSLQETYLPPRCRKVRTRIINIPIPLLMKEVKHNDAPIALTTTTLEWRKVENGISKDGTDLIPVSTDYRWYKSKLYTPFIDNSGKLKTIDDVIRYISIYDYWNYTNEALIKTLKKGLRQFVIIDNIIHKITGEPRYVINTFGLGHNHGGTGFFVENFYNSNIRKERYYNALQRDEAIAYGKQIASGRGDTKSIDGIGTRCDIQVFIPEAVKCNPNKEHGNGCAFINSMESLVSGSGSVMEAGFLVVSHAAQIRNIKQL